MKKKTQKPSTVQAFAMFFVFVIGVGLGFWLDRPETVEKENPNIAKYQKLVETDTAIIDAFNDDTDPVKASEILLEKGKERKQLLSELGYAN